MTGFDYKKLRSSDVVENTVIRVSVLGYVLFAHVAMLVFKITSGLKIQWINHKPWPYRKMYTDFKRF